MTLDDIIRALSDQWPDGKIDHETEVFATLRGCGNCSPVVVAAISCGDGEYEDDSGSPLPEGSIVLEYEE